MLDKSNLIDNASQAFKEICGAEPVITGSAAGNDARLFSNILNIPTIILGPGKLRIVILLMNISNSKIILTVF